jgi:Zn-dependent protease
MSPQPASTPDRRPPPRWASGIPAGRIFGVPLVVSPAWLVVVVVGTVVLASTVRDHDRSLGVAAGYLVSFTLVMLVYLAVLIHEASHVLVAKALGMKVGRVVLQLFGAISEVLEEASTPGREYLVAAVGPTTSLLLAGIAAAAGAQFPHDSVGYLLGWGSAWVNGIVAAFNLLPGLPLDGGRLLRAAVWQVTHDKLRGLLIAGWVGRVLAAIVLLTGFYAPGSTTGGHTYGALYLIVVAFFLYSNASMSIAQARVGNALPRLDLATLIRPALTVDGQLPLAEAVRRARLGNARALVVVDSHEHWSGIVSEAAVQATPVERQPWMSVSELARPVEDGLVLDPGLSAEALMTAVQRKPATEYLVASADGTLRGVLARADLAAALRAAGVH